MLSTSAKAKMILRKADLFILKSANAGCVGRGKDVAVRAVPLIRPYQHIRQSRYARSAPFTF
jgi:hypothetical protein